MNHWTIQKKLRAINDWLTLTPLTRSILEGYTVIGGIIKQFDFDDSKMVLSMSATTTTMPYDFWVVSLLPWELEDIDQEFQRRLRVHGKFYTPEEQ